MSVKSLVVIFCLSDDSWFEHTNADLLSDFAQKDAICKVVRSPSQARRYLASTIRPHAVILADDKVTKPEFHELHARLVQYATAGGTVVYAGRVSTSSLFPDPETMFGDVWGLPWRICKSHTSGVGHTVNPVFKGFDAEGLVTQCSFFGVRVKDVELEDAVYVADELANNLGDTSTPPAPGRTYKTPAAFAKIGQGRVGYITETGCHPRERAITNLIMTMCFWPGSCAPLAPGDGVPDMVCDSSQVQAQMPSPHPSTSTAAAEPKRNVLVISLGQDVHTTNTHARFFQALRKHATVTEAKHLRAAQAALSGPPPPSSSSSTTTPSSPDAVILSDDALARPKHSALLARLVDYARAGGTVVLALQFGRALRLKPAQARPFFARWGVPWGHPGTAAAALDLKLQLNPAGVPAPLRSDALAPSLSAEAVHVGKVPREHAVYLPARADLQGPTATASDAGQESPAAFASVGRGHVGYVGDVSGDGGLGRLVLEMCGVKIAPGEMGLGEDEDVACAVRPRAPRRRDEEVAVRADARRKAREERRERAEKLKNEGNDFFKLEEWFDAAEKYRSAALVGGPHPTYMSNLAACLLKLEMWELADSAASRALVYDPRHVKALYRRALARKELDRFRAALADLEWLLTIDKENTPALREKAAVQERLDLIGSFDWLGDKSARGQRDQDVAMNIEDELDLGDFAHPGAGIACREHNTSDTGCPDGKTCRFRHVQDWKSVRDELGRNVCVYWLVGHCRFSESVGGECSYAHDATYLPKSGWWTDTARFERMRAEFDTAVKEAPLDLGAGVVEERILAEAFVPLPWQKDPWMVELYCDDRDYDDSDDDDYSDYGVDSSDLDSSEPGGCGLGSDEGSEDHCDYGYGLGEGEEEERGELNEFGVTDADVEEMWEYGIKPWEEGAYAEMLRIRRILSSL